MRNRLVLILLLVILTAGILFSRVMSLPNLQAKGPDSYYTQWGSTQYDALHYDLDLNVNVDANFLSGVVTIDATAKEDLTEFALDLRGLTVTEVLVNDQPATFSQTDAKLWITPPLKLVASESFTSRITYSGNPQPFISESDPNVAVGWIKYQDGIVVLGEPDGASNWFPSNNHPTDKATYTVRVTTPKQYNVFGNGVLTDQVNHDTETTYTWQMDKPMASYLVCINISTYVDKIGDVNGVPLRFYATSASADTVDIQLAYAKDMIPYFSQIFGPYPFSTYGGVVIDVDSAPTEEIKNDWESLYGLETQSFTLFFKNNDVDLAAHELAHQWFGNDVSLTDWHDIWLKEGFAKFAEWLWEEHLDGAQSLRDKLLAPDAYDKFVAEYEAYPPGNPPRDNLYHATVYVRGAMTLYALRLKLGDDTFFHIVRTFVDQFSYSNASTKDFIKVAEEVSNQDLSAFFDTWLYSTHLPKRIELGLP